MPLALRFPLETAAAVARHILDGTFDRFPRLRLITARANDVLPDLASRLDACVMSDFHSPVHLRNESSTYLRHLYFDAIGHQTLTLALLIYWWGWSKLHSVRIIQSLDRTRQYRAGQHGVAQSDKTRRGIQGTWAGGGNGDPLPGNAMLALNFSLPN